MGGHPLAQEWTSHSTVVQVIHPSVPETSSLLEVPQPLGNKAGDEEAGYFHAVY